MLTMQRASFSIVPQLCFGVLRPRGVVRIRLQVNAMRTTLLILALLGEAAPAFCQDAAQIQMQMAQQAQINQQNQQQMQIAQQANQQAMQDAQSAALACESCQIAAAPQASVVPGFYSMPITLSLKTRTRRAQIFYTTDGWTPTRQSTLYTGPITIASTETLQVVTIAPGYAHSGIRVLTYTFPAATVPGAAAMHPVAKASTGPYFLPEGTPVPLRFVTALDSANAYVGQPIQLELATNLVVDGFFIAHAGSKAQGVVTAVDPPGRQSAPGILTFAAKSIEIDGAKVPLTGTRTREGKDESKRQFLTLIPVAGPLTLLRHGDSAHIDPGAEFVATVAEATTLSASIQ